MKTSEKLGLVLLIFSASFFNVLCLFAINKIDGEIFVHIVWLVSLWVGMICLFWKKS
jgi:hypothetical protein